MLKVFVGLDMVNTNVGTAFTFEGRILESILDLTSRTIIYSACKLVKTILTVTANLHGDQERTTKKRYHRMPVGFSDERAEVL